MTASALTRPHSGKDQNMKRFTIKKIWNRILEHLAIRSRVWRSTLSKGECDVCKKRRRAMLEHRYRYAQRLRFDKAQHVNGIAVRNRFRVRGKPRCANHVRRRCRRIATTVVGSYGYCQQHANAAKDRRKRIWRHQDPGPRTTTLQTDTAEGTS